MLQKLGKNTNVCSLVDDLMLRGLMPQHHDGPVVGRGCKVGPFTERQRGLVSWTLEEK